MMYGLYKDCYLCEDTHDIRDMHELHDGEYVCSTCKPKCVTCDWCRKLVPEFEAHTIGDINYCGPCANGD